MSKRPSFQPAVEEIRSLCYLQCQRGPMYEFPVWLPLQISKTSANNIFSLYFIFLFLWGKRCSPSRVVTEAVAVRRCRGTPSIQETQGEKCLCDAGHCSSDTCSSGPRSVSMPLAFWIRMQFTQKPKVFPNVCVAMQKMTSPLCLF